MKKIRIKRWIGMLLALCIVMGFSNFSLTVLAAENLAVGETLTELTQDETMQTNNGTIITNNGTVETNYYDATVETNNGTVTENYGIVTDNFYTVKTNSGTVNINHDTVNSNRGTVETNYYNAMVETNYGTVNINHGIVTDNFYTVKTNSGTVETNYYNATVESNNGTVTTNASGGTVTDNYGTVETNNGKVVNNYGGTVGGTSAINNYYKLTYEADNVTVSGLTVKNGNSYILSTASVTLAPPSSQHFKSVVITPEGATLTENDNGTYTLSGVTENIVLTVSTIEHSYSTDWKSDGTNHWRECSCGAKTDEAAHNGGTETCTKKAICSVCDEEYGELAEHTYGTEWKSDGTNHWHECSCGVKTDEAAHSYGTKWKSDGANHWHECTCGAKTDEAAHNGGTTTCTKKAICSVCDEEYGELAEHSYGTKWKSDGINHWHECTCGAKTNEAAHSGGTATCKDKAVCSACGTVYGELAAHNYKDGKCIVCEIADPNYVPETDSPQTSDNSYIVLWIALLLLSGGAIITLTVVNIKRKTIAKR